MADCTEKFKNLHECAQSLLLAVILQIPSQQLF